MPPSPPTPLPLTREYARPPARSLAFGAHVARLFLVWEWRRAHPISRLSSSSSAVSFSSRTIFSVVEVKLDASATAMTLGTLGACARRALLAGVSQDVHAIIRTDARINGIHNHAEVFDAQTEASFQSCAPPPALPRACRRAAIARRGLIAALPPYDLPPPFETARSLQVLSAVCVSFAHGANDVANACGPLAGIWATYQAGEFVAETETPVWVLIIGAVGLVIGLATYGYNIMRALGVRMAAMTPSRGYAAELSTSLVISIASAYGMPISTTHTITGAVVGVGLMEGRAGVNWWQFSRVFAAWVFTLIFTGAFAAALFAQGVYAPSLG